MEAAFEEDVRRYLMRKPMTTTELLKKFKTKKTGLPKDELMPGEGSFIYYNVGNFWLFQAH